MAMLYKLTDANGQTHGGCQWGPGVTHTASGKGDLCGPGWLHAYTDPLLAVLMNPIHAMFISPRLWEAEGEIGKTDHGLKVGCMTLTTVREIPLPEITAEQCVRFGILCALQVTADAEWRSWAERWLSGDDRSEAAVMVAMWAVANARQVVAEARASAEAAAISARHVACMGMAAFRAAMAAFNAAAAAELDVLAIARQAVEQRPRASVMD